MKRAPRIDRTGSKRAAATSGVSPSAFLAWISTPAERVPTTASHVPLHDAARYQPQGVVVEDDLRRGAALHVALEVGGDRDHGVGPRREDLVERLGRARERARHPHRLRRVDHPDEPAREERAVGVDDGDRQVGGEAVPEDRRHEGESRERQEDEKDEGVPARNELVRLPPGRAEDARRVA